MLNHPPENQADLDSVYHHLCRLARSQLNRGKRHETLNTHALVHELFLKLEASRHKVMESQDHYFAVAAKAMRQIICDYARKKRANKRGGYSPVQSLETIEGHEFAIHDHADEILNLNVALEALEELDKRLLQIAELRYFGGCSVEEVADILDISTATVKRDSRLARAFLLEKIGQKNE